MKTKIVQNIKSIILALILVVGVSYVSAASVWSNPTAAAPGNNADKPLNVGSAGQVKAGGLTLNTGGAATGLIVRNGNVVIGDPATAGTGAGTGIKFTKDGIVFPDGTIQITADTAPEAAPGTPTGFTETAVNLAEDSYGSLVGASCSLSTFGSTNKCTSLDTCNGSVTATDYVCGASDAKTCTDVVTRNEFNADTFQPAYVDVPYKRTVTCKKATVMVKVY